MIKVSDDADAFCAGSPQREQRPFNALMRHQMTAEFLINLLMIPLAKEAEVASLDTQCGGLADELSGLRQIRQVAKSGLGEAITDLDILKKNYAAWAEDRRKDRESFEDAEAEGIAGIAWRKLNDQD